MAAVGGEPKVNGGNNITQSKQTEIIKSQVNQKAQHHISTKPSVDAA
jgi:hypothetical protein